MSLPSDLAVSLEAAPALPAVGDPLIYTVHLTNTAPLAATDVVLTNLLPAGVSFLSAVPSQGGCTNFSGVVRCPLGALAAQSQATIIISCVPTNEATLTNRVFVTRADPDLTPANNAATNIVLVRARLLTVSSPAVVEGDSSVTNAVFQLTLSVPANRALALDFATSNNTATAGSDYLGTNGTLVFAPGETNLTLAVPVFGDTLFEATETFTLHAWFPTNPAIPAASGQCVITNDDAPPMVFLRDASVVEGESGPTNAIFLLELSAASGLPVTINYSTSNGTALAGSDYLGTNGVILLPPGATNTNIVIVVLGDPAPEASEQFYVQLDSVLGASPGRAQAVGTILSDDARPVIVAATATLLADANTNSVIDPGEIITVSLAVRNLGVAATTNLVATLLATNGVTAPGAPQNFGVVPVGTNAVARSFTFTAEGTNGGVLTAMLQLHDNGSDLGTVAFSLLIGPRLERFEWAAIPAAQQAHVPFAVTITARDHLDRPLTNFTGTVALSATNGSPSVALPLTPAVSGSFSNGVWSGAVTVEQAGTNVVLHAGDGAGHGGASTPFNVASNPAAVLTRFAWSVAGPTQFIDVPFTVTLAAKNALDETMTNFTGAVALSATGVVPVSFALRGNLAPDNTLNAGTFTLGFAFTPTNDLVVTHFRHYSGTKVSFWNSNGVLLASAAITNPPGAWSETPLATPLALTAGTRYLVGFLNGGLPYYWRSETTTNFSHGRINGSFYGSSDSFPDNPFANGWWLVDVRFTAPGLAPLPVLPPGSGNFTGGLWTTSLTITQAVASLVLRAEDQAGHTAESNPIQVIAEPPRLSITRQANQAVVTWTLATPGYVLESASPPGGMTAWSPVTNAISVNGTLHTLTNTILGSAKFFRLRKL